MVEPNLCWNFFDYLHQILKIKALHHILVDANNEITIGCLSIGCKFYTTLNPLNIGLSIVGYFATNKNALAFGYLSEPLI